MAAPPPRKGVGPWWEGNRSPRSRSRTACARNAHPPSSLRGGRGSTRPHLCGCNTDSQHGGERGGPPFPTKMARSIFNTARPCILHFTTRLIVRSTFLQRCVQRFREEGSFLRSNILFVVSTFAREIVPLLLLRHFALLLEYFIFTPDSYITRLSIFILSCFFT